jgi:glyoxylase-like metal-dependent hydrolase (beta-lactamase superfamily II)
MQSISRRGFVISAATAGAAFGLDGPLEFISPAFAQKAVMDFARFQVGDIEVIQMYDGVWERAHDEKFVKNASLDEVKAALKAGGLTDAYVPTPFTVTAVRRKGKVVLFDSGTGAQLAATAGNIARKDLWKKVLKIDPAKVDAIVITHFHPDHISGLMAKDTNAPIFPNARIFVPAAEYKFWTNPSVTAAAAKRIQAVFPTWKNIEQFEGDKEVVPGVRAIATPGHTAGHTCYHLASGQRQLIVLGDVSNIPALFVKNPGWHGVFDSDGPLAETNRRKIYDRVIADKAVITGYHFGMPGAGTIKKDGKGYVFAPIGARGLIGGGSVSAA